MTTIVKYILCNSGNVRYCNFQLVFAIHAVCALPSGDPPLSPSNYTYLAHPLTAYIAIYRKPKLKSKRLLLPKKPTRTDQQKKIFRNITPSNIHLSNTDKQFTVLRSLRYNFETCFVGTLNCCNKFIKFTCKSLAYRWATNLSIIVEKPRFQ